MQELTYENKIVYKIVKFEEVRNIPKNNGIYITMLTNGKFAYVAYDYSAKEIKEIVTKNGETIDKTFYVAKVYTREWGIEWTCSSMGGKAQQAIEQFCVIEE